MRAVLRLALLTLLTLLLCAEASHAQVDLAKALVGRWEGEQEFLVERSEDPKRTLVIESVTQTDGNWVANGRYGTSAGMGRVRIDVETSGAQPGLNWVSASGAQYQLNLIQDRYLVGKVILTVGQNKRTTGSRDRTLKLEKVN